MSPRRRTLCFVLIFLLRNNDLDFVTGLPVRPALTEYCPSPGSPPQLVNSLSTVTSGPGNRVLPDVQQRFPTQQFNEVFSFGLYPPGLSIDTVATSNYGVIKPNPFNTHLTNSPIETSNSLPVVKTITESLPYLSNVESSTMVEKYPPVTQSIQVEGHAPTANVAEIYQTPITVQIPSMPQMTPFIGVASPLAEILPSQNIMQEIYTANAVPKIYPQTIETITSVPVEPTTLNIPSSGLGGCDGQQLPVALQINISSLWGSEPVQAVISQPALAPRPSPSFDPSFSMPPAPIIVVEESKSKLKSILPILLLTLFDGGCGNSGGGSGSCSCSQCSATPVPFPILIPTNNPVITRGSQLRSKGKGKAPTDAKC